MPQLPPPTHRQQWRPQHHLLRWRLLIILPTWGSRNLSTITITNLAEMRVEMEKAQTTAYRAAASTARTAIDTAKTDADRAIAAAHAGRLGMAVILAENRHQAAYAASK